MINLPSAAMAEIQQLAGIIELQGIIFQRKEMQDGQYREVSIRNHPHWR